MKLHEQELEDYLRNACRVKDPRILNAVKGRLSDREQESIEAHASIVSQNKLVAVVQNPDRLKEIILIREDAPGEVYRCDLTLKRKQSPGKI